jgi:DNA ligase (NAD+)
MAKILRGGRAARGVCVALCWLIMGVVRLCAVDERGELVRKIETLRAEIARHDELYFKKAAPEISDEVYDRLKRELTTLEARAVGNRTAGMDEKIDAGVYGVTGVGDDRSGRFATRAHGERMMSLEKVYTETELQAFLKRVEADVRETGRASGSGGEFRVAQWVVEPKYDGLAVSATYERGKLVRVVTRGNGIEGDDVTANARMIAALPEVLSGAERPERIEVRGEVFADFATFERVNAAREDAGETLFANPRALAAGSLKLGDTNHVRARGLRVVFYGWGEVQPRSVRTATQSAFHEQLRAWGLPGVEQLKRAGSAADVCDAVREFARERAMLGFPTDGVVIKLDDVAQQERLGATAHAPRWAVAYKFSTERATTRVKGITIQVGRSGVLTPVAELEPVRLGGSTVARATLHNAEEISRLDVRVGDRVWVEKAGEIIPAVVGVTLTEKASPADAGRAAAPATRFAFPEDCPACGGAVVTRTDDGVRQYCVNRDCAAQVVAKLRHFAGAQGVAIRGLGEETIARLVEQKGVRTPADIYRLTQEDWRVVEGLGAKSAEKLFVAVEASKRAELWRFIHGLGVPGTGVATSRILAARFSSLEELSDADASMLAKIDGVGAAQAKALSAFFAEPENRRMVAQLRTSGVEPREIAAGDSRNAGQGSLAGKVFVLTGTLPTWSRAQAEERIAAAGGTVAGSVTARTDFVVVGKDAGEKRRQAEAKGVRVIDEAELRRLLAGDVTDQ